MISLPLRSRIDRDRIFLWIALGVGTFLGLLFAPKSLAGSFYIETGLGISQYFGATDLFPTAGTATERHFGSSLTIAENLASSNDSFLQVHLGAKARLTNAQFKDHYYGIFTLSPLLRLETRRFYLGFGYTPLVWVRDRLSYGTQGYQRLNSGSAYFGEFGWLWKIVPFFYVTLEASGAQVLGPQGISPKLEAMLTINFRFLYGPIFSGGKKGTRVDGWRYPFGIGQIF